MNVLITGASRGLGLEFVRQYLSRGERVFAATRKPEEATGLAALKSDRLTLVPLDVEDAASIRAAHDLVRGHVDALHLLINNAGVYAGRGNAVGKTNQSAEKLGELTMDDALHVFRTNSIGPVLVAQAFWDLLRASQRPKIVSVTSGYGSVSGNSGGFPYHYSASKAALNMYMRSLAGDAKSIGGVVAVVDPGWVRTDMGGAGATLSPEESVGGLVRVIDALAATDNGSFIDYRGKHVAW